MRILFAGGGTAGHINPALAIAGYIREKEPKTEILYIGAKGGMEEKLVPAAGFRFCSITISGFQRKDVYKRQDYGNAHFKSKGITAFLLFGCGRSGTGQAGTYFNSTKAP